MQDSAYSFHHSDDYLSFEFDSVSSEKTIRKVVVYKRFPNGLPVFNLSLSDKNEDGSSDDLARSNNNDLVEVMATVIQTLFVFFENYPESAVYFRGSTPARTRLYQIIIQKELAEAQKWFFIQGVRAEAFEEFRPNKIYDAFLIQRLTSF